MKQRAWRQWWACAWAIAALAGAGCGKSNTEGGEPSEARIAVEKGAILLDVRSPDEFADGHLAGAINIPVDALAGRLGELDDKRAVVVYCRSGRRNAAAASTLRDAGRQVIDIGPMSAW